MITVSIDTAEIRRAISDLQGWALKRRVAVDRAVAETAVAVERGAKERAPVDTGRLRSSIHTMHPKVMLRQVGTNVEYAPHQEFGTRFMQAQPFLFPAAEAEREAHIERIKRALGGLG